MNGLETNELKKKLDDLIKNITNEIITDSNIIDLMKNWNFSLKNKMNLDRAQPKPFKEYRALISIKLKIKQNELKMKSSDANKYDFIDTIINKMNNEDYMKEVKIKLFNDTIDKYSDKYALEKLDRLVDAPDIDGTKFKNGIILLSDNFTQIIAKL